MKKLILKFVAVTATCALMFAPVGCETLNQVYTGGTVSVSEHTADQLILDAEKTAQIGLDTFDTFIRLERAHRDAYAQISPKIHEFSAWLRYRILDPTEDPSREPPIHMIPRGEAILKVLRKATKTFEDNRTAENRASLMTAYTTVQSVIQDCRRYTTLATTRN